MIYPLKRVLSRQKHNRNYLHFAWENKDQKGTFSISKLIALKFKSLISPIRIHEATSKFNRRLK
jgi:hypothetical protein